MNHETDAARERGPGRPPRPLRYRAILATLALLAGCLAGVFGTVLAVAPTASADSVPAPPAGWTTVFGDDFAGAAGSAPAAAAEPVRGIRLLDRRGHIELAARRGLEVVAVPRVPDGGRHAA